MAEFPSEYRIPLYTESQPTARPCPSSPVLASPEVLFFLIIHSATLDSHLQTVSHSDTRCSQMSQESPRGTKEQGAGEL